MEERGLFKLHCYNKAYEISISLNMLYTQHMVNMQRCLVYALNS
jgi:hypothetical protein